MKLAWLLGNPEIRQHKGWNKLSNQFFEHHREDILIWCKYDKEEQQMPVLPVEQVDVLVDVFSGMKRAGIFGRSSFMDLALWMRRFFRINNEANSLCRKLEAFDGYSFLKIWRNYWMQNSEKPGNK